MEAGKKRAVERVNWGTGISLSREDEVLIYCARLNLSPARREALKDILAGEMDWDLLLEKATWHRLLCLASHHLKNADLRALVPQLVLQKLQRVYYLSLARNMLFQDGLSQLLSALNKEGIPVIVLKGPALLGSVYQDISLRPMSDLDILIQPEHLDRAEAIALRQGFVYIASRYSQELARMKVRHLANMVHVQKRIPLEIHQHIVDLDSPYHFDLSSFWARAQHVTILGADALTFAPEDLLIYLGINFLRDRRYSSVSAVGQLCDISEVILHYGDSLNWNLIEKSAKEYGIAPTLHCVFYICEQLLGTQVPASVLARLQPLEFDPSMATLFIRRRLLSTVDSVSLDLMAPRSRYSRYRALLAIINKLFHIPLRIFQEHEYRGRRISYYFRLMEHMVPALARMLLRPMELKQDLLLDRWLHDLGSDNTQTMSPVNSLEYGSTVASSSKR